MSSLFALAASLVALLPIAPGEDDLEIVVVDADGGRVSGLAVTLWALEPSSGRSVWSGRTNKEGIATVKDAATLFGEMREGEVPWIDVDFLGPGAPRVELDPDSISSKPVSLALPPAGRLRVSLQAVDGSTIQEPFTVESAAFGEARFSVRPTMIHSGRWRGIAGELSIDPVALDLTFDLVPRLERSTGRFDLVSVSVNSKRIEGVTPKTIPGPASPGDEVHVVFRLVDDQLVVTGRLVDPEGNPVGNRRLGWINSRVDGRFRFGVSRRERRFREAMKLRTDWREGPTQAVHLDLSDAPESGELELGDVVLVPCPLIASGVVMDRDAKPIPNARITVSSKAKTGKLPTSFHARSGEDGRFQVFGDLEGTILITATSPGFCSTVALEINAHAERVEVVLARAGRVAGRLILPDRQPCPDFFWRWKHAEYIEPAPWRFQVPRRTGAFILTEVPPGLVDLDLVCGRLGNNVDMEVVRVLEDVEVRAGQTTTLAALDVRPILDLIRIEVVDESGASIPFATVRYRSNVDPRRQIRLDAYASDLAIPSFGAPLDLTISSPGYRDTLIESCRTDQQVTMRPAFGIRFQLPPDVDLEDRRLRIRAVSGHRGRPVEYSFKEGDPLLVRVPRSGAWNFRWSVGTAHTTDVARNVIVNVTKDEDLQVVQLTL